MRLGIYSLLIPALLALSPSSADAHLSSGNTHVRRALSSKLQRRQLLGLPDSLGSVVNGLGDGLGLPLGSPSPAEVPPTSTATSSNTSSSTTGTDTTTTTPTTTTTSTHTTSSTPGGLLGPVTSLLGPGVSPVTSLLGPTSISPTNVPPTSSAGSDPSSGSGSSSGGVTPPPSSDPTSAPAPTSSSQGGGIISGILSGVTSVLLPPSSTPAPSSSAGDPGSPVPSSSSSSGGGIVSGILSTLTSVVLPPSSSPTSPPSSTPSSSSDGGILSSLTSIILPPPTSSLPTSSLPTSLPTSSIPISDPPTSIPTSIISSLPPTSMPNSSVIISFPTSVVSSTSSGNATSTVSGIKSTITPSTTVSINSDLSFVLTESSLIYASLPTTTAEPTLTDPDQATTTVNTQNGPTPATTLSAAPLPTGIPGRIYPRVQLDLSSVDASKYTLISILFNQELNWPFVVTNQISSSQIFAWIPAIISTALGVPSNDVKTWALQVYVPASYHGPADAVQLGTMWLGYIPSDQVDTLAAQIKAKQSAFYTGVADPVAQALAQHVNPGFSLNAIADPNLNNEGGLTGPGSSSNGAGGDNGKSRQDAIIGVVTALGVIALLVLAFLVYRSMKRRRELAHRRLSDPPDTYVGVRPEGREFDQDSVGGARRRSFYYAEDSLRGFQQHQQQQQIQEVSQHPGGGFVQRRNVMPSAISAPILQESSMNW
ncbi:putative biological adhesion [Lyophyllum shimeji]|uniref:Biological adhesion n=1 Tax=Lyophyllum shimeji TaxID=47721 RepID=A0A9P3Q1B5_LYOSH|nr:putative biological adhesion [Lyophyllum shimeji]